tara:strand:- start:681 stop:1655 length:975 start_codon:yes stop_codon:yes gene_type:complete
MIKVLVTGVGAIIGYGIINSLRQYKEQVFIIGCDIYHDAVGRNWCDCFAQAPLTSDSSYLSWIKELVHKHQINLIIPGIEQDAHFFNDNINQMKDSGAKIATNNPFLINKSKDKWEMYKELMLVKPEINIPSVIKGTFNEIVEVLGTPFILKPRKSYAGKGIVQIKTQSQYDQYKHLVGTELMAQKIVGNEENEFTVGAFGDGCGNIQAIIIFKRKLSQEGATSKAIVICDDMIRDATMELARYFKPNGPTNLQFRKDTSGIKLLEINARVSSSTSIRTAFGYNESAMCIDYYLYNAEICQPVIKKGTAARYIADQINYESNNF